jgi:hypothetical protein
MDLDDIKGDVDHYKMVDVWTPDVVQLLNQLVHLDDILYGGDYIDGDLYDIFFSLVASTTP